jgi:hypothetical protein
MTKTKQCKCGGGGIYNVHLESCNEPKDTKEEEHFNNCLKLWRTDNTLFCLKGGSYDVKECKLCIENNPTEQSPIVQDWKETFKKNFTKGRNGLNPFQEQEVLHFIEKVVSQQVSKALEGQKEKILKIIDDYWYGDYSLIDEVITKIKQTI